MQKQRCTRAPRRSARASCSGDSAMSESTYKKPLPRPNRLSTPLYEGAKRYELLLQRCSVCHTWRFPPSERCPNCLSTEYAWEAASGRGRVWSWIVMHQRYYAAFESDLPYNVAYIVLDEGPKLMTNLV